MQMADRIWRVGTEANVYVVDCGGPLALIDCGSAFTAPENLAALEADGLDLGRVQALLVTHAHWDHVAGLAATRARLGCPVIAHPEARRILEDGDPVKSGAVKEYLDFYTPFDPCPVDHEVQDGDEIAIGRRRFGVRHLPGHTWDTVAFALGRDLFTGDILMPEGAIGWVGVTWGSNLEDYRETLQWMREFRPRFIYPGHGDPFRFRAALVDRAQRQIVAVMKSGVAPCLSANRAPRRPADEPRGVVRPTEPSEPAAKPPRRLDLRANRVYEFRAGELTGLLRPQGRFHGIEYTAGRAQVRITEPSLCMMNLEHYLCVDRHGSMAPRNARQHYRVEDQTVTLRFEPTPDWRLRAAVTYDLSVENRLDTWFRFDFGQDYPRFEAFVASYFHAGNPPPFLRSAGEWFRPEIEPREHRFFPRDAQSTGLITDGRWKGLELGRFTAGVDPRAYDFAMHVSLNETTGWAVLLMTDPSLCPSISANLFCHAQDFSLIGRDVAAGDSVTVRTRLLYVPLSSPDDAVPHYQQFLDEIAA
jgi:glyoxylase-like metal-dependent hydrolase (beta-lactamase superfamily II)